MKKMLLLALSLCLLSALLVGCSSEETETDPPQTSTTASTTQTDSTGTTDANGSQILSEDEVKRFALFCAGTTEEKISDYQVKLTYNEERECQVYEISFNVGRISYEYVFRATDCDIIVNNKVIHE